MTIQPVDIQLDRKERGAFFTPEPIAAFLTEWAIAGRPEATVFDPTCGEAVFLCAAADHLRSLGRSDADISEQLFGADVHSDSLLEAAALLQRRGASARMHLGDFFALPAPDDVGPMPAVDAVVGNPPFVRYQQHAGETRERSLGAASAQGVELSGLASSWASTLVHASAFLSPGGRLAMVLPAELFTVHYAEPVRRWLRERFASVHLVTFERLQFGDALARVVLVLAEGEGGCDSLAFHRVEDSTELAGLLPLVGSAAQPPADGKWTILLLDDEERRVFAKASASYVGLGSYGSVGLGTVTGRNSFFVVSEETRRRFDISKEDVLATCPPGTRHFRGLTFTKADWRRARDSGQPVWLLYPGGDVVGPGLRRYLQLGVGDGVDTAYKCRVRTPWWRPPAARVPDVYFTYMSHHQPRLISNRARTTFLNSMHGLTLNSSAPAAAASALPYLTVNAVTLLGAELHGRSYGGGILKMEPREAARLPVPSPELLALAWDRMGNDASRLERTARAGTLDQVQVLVDRVLLRETLGLSEQEVGTLERAARRLRSFRSPAS